jgi:hypothetical protein
LIISKFFVSGILTGDDVTVLHAITKDFFEGCTILSGVGYWDNTREDVFIIEVAPTNVKSDLDKRLWGEKKRDYALCLATQFEQEAVMMLDYEAEVTMFEPDNKPLKVGELKKERRPFYPHPPR